MPEDPADQPSPHSANRAALLAELIPIMGEQNALECLDVPITEDQRRAIAEIVASAPRRLA